MKDVRVHPSTDRPRLNKSPHSPGGRGGRGTANRGGGGWGGGGWQEVIAQILD